MRRAPILNAATANRIEAHGCSSMAVHAALWALGSTGAPDKLREKARYPVMAAFQNHKRLGF